MKDWSVCKDNQHVDQQDIYTGYRSVIASVSAERGVELLKIYRTAINADRFIPYLQQLRKKNGEKPLALFMDQLSVHREKNVKPFYQQLDIMPIFNVSYSPEYNPIESCFSQVKRHFCAERLNVLANFGVFD